MQTSLLVSRSQEAKEFVTERLLNRVVYVKCLEKDQYGRLLARVLIPRSEDPRRDKGGVENKEAGGVEEEQKGTLEAEGRDDQRKENEVHKEEDTAVVDVVICFCLHMRPSPGKNKKKKKEEDQADREVSKQLSRKLDTTEIKNEQQRDPSWWCEDICEELLMEGLACLYR